MDRFFSIILWAGLGCFALAFVLSGLYPYLITDGSVPEASIEELAKTVPVEFKDLKERFPVAFTSSFPGSEAALVGQELAGVSLDDPLRVASDAAWRAAYQTALRDGRDVYVGEGCWHCHSQYVRPVANEDVRFGPVSRWEQDNNELQRPVMWGTRRVGPDLTYEGGLRSNDWHVAHFWDPQSTSPGSVMPRFPWFFRDGWQIHRRIDADIARRTGLDPETAYPVPGVYPTRAEAEAALVDFRAGLPSSLTKESDRLFVAEGQGLNAKGLSVVAYLQWLGTWQPEGREVD